MKRDGFLVENEPGCERCEAECNGVLIPEASEPSKAPISVLVIQKRTSHSFCDLMSGRAATRHLDIIVDELTCPEKRLIREHADKDFRTLRLASNFRGRASRSRVSEKSYEDIRTSLFNHLEESLTHYPFSEIGFPKGRPERGETRLECALREFNEETGMRACDLEVPEFYPRLTETFMGSDRRQYSHTYFITKVKENYARPYLDPNNHEVQNIGWVPVDHLSCLFRSYEDSKKRLALELARLVAL